MKLPQPPAHLQASGRKFWRLAHSEREFADSHDITRLDMACGCLDEIAADEARVKVEGAFVSDRFQQVKEHPARRAIRENKALFLKIVRELGLDLVAPSEDRPRRQY